MLWLYLAEKTEDISGMTLSWETVIAPERLQKINRMKNKNAAELSLTAGLLLHRACKEAGIEGAERKLGYTEKGRPYFLEYPDYYFNISHSGDFACVVFGTGNSGVDIEKIHPVKESAVKRVFTEAEREWLNRRREEHPADSYERDIIRLWTRKESYGKYLGEGLSERVMKTSLCRDCSMKKDGVNKIAVNREVQFLEYGIPGYWLSICLGGQEKAGERATIKIPSYNGTVKINIEL